MLTVSLPSLKHQFFSGFFSEAQIVYGASNGSETGNISPGGEVPDGNTFSCRAFFSSVSVIHGPLLKMEALLSKAWLPPNDLPLRVTCCF